MKKFFLMLGRVFISLIFIAGVANYFLNWDASLQLLVSGIGEWMKLPGIPEQVTKILNWMQINASLLLIIAALFAGVGGILVFLGIKAELGSILLILFLIPTTVLLHSFWLFQGSLRDAALSMFLKNVSVLGGLFVLAATSTKRGQE